MLSYEELSERIKTLNTEVATRKATHEELDRLMKNAKECDHIGAQVHIQAANGYLSYVYGQTKEAFEMLFSAFSLATQINDIEALTRTQYTLGAVYASMGLYEHAFQHFLLAMESAKKNGLDTFLGGVYNNIGVCLFKQDLVEEAGMYCKQAYEYFSDKSNLPNHVFTSLNMAVYHMRIHEFDKAESYLKRVEGDMKGLPDILTLGRNINYARLHAYKGEYERSLAEMTEIFENYYSGKTEVSLYDHMLEWCHIFNEGDHLHMVKGLLERVLAELKDDQSITVADLMLLLAELYEDDGEYKKSTEYYNKAVKINREFFKKNQQFVSQNALKLIEMTEKNQELANKSYRDAMTGWYNRFALQSEGKEIINEFVKNGKKIAVIMFDIDYFKQYNDFYGHLNGDTCIKTITSAIQSLLPDEMKYVYRYGGDEFLVLLPLEKYSGDEIARMMLESIRDLKLPHERSPVSEFTTISIGISTKNENHNNLQTAIDAADMNLYRAKFNKRNCACVDEDLLS